MNRERNEESWLLSKLPAFVCEQSTTLAALFPNATTPPDWHVTVTHVNGCPIDDPKALRTVLQVGCDHVVQMSIRRLAANWRASLPANEEDGDTVRGASRSAAVRRRGRRPRQPLLMGTDTSPPSLSQDVHRMPSQEAATVKPRRRGRPRKTEVANAPAVAPGKAFDEDVEDIIAKIKKSKKRTAASTAPLKLMNAAEGEPWFPETVAKRRQSRREVNNAETMAEVTTDAETKSAAPRNKSTTDSGTATRDEFDL